MPSAALISAQLAPASRAARITAEADSGAGTLLDLKTTP